MRLILLGVLRPMETTEHGATLIEPDFPWRLYPADGASDDGNAVGKAHGGISFPRG